MKYKEKRKIPVTKSQVICVAAGIFLYIFIEILSILEGGRGNRDLKRAPPGQGETTYEIEVSGLNGENKDEKILMEIPVGEKVYTKEEAEKLFEEIRPQLEQEILGENESLLHVRKDLTLKSILDDYGINIRWETDKPDLVSSLGKVDNEEVEETGEEVVLKAHLSNGNYEHTYSFSLVVYPPDISKEEKDKIRFLNWIKQEDKRQQTENYLQLPDQYEDRSLTYHLSKDTSHRMFPFMGLFAAFLLYWKKDADKKQQGKRREEMLLLDYSEVVSKLVVYIGAGITVRGALERIAAGYDAGVKEGRRSVRPVYEEIGKTVSHLGSGISESKAIGDFGRRCGLKSYLKLSALLEQSRKNGSKQLRQSLELEMISAFEERKNLAKKLGEEAGTKLLIPLLLMLTVVMTMIVVPAFLSFY